MMHDYWYWNGWTWGGMWLGHLVWIVLVGLGVYAVARLLARDNLAGPGARPRSALDVLEERFAKGEIDKDEFELRRRTLAGR